MKTSKLPITILVLFGATVLLSSCSRQNDAPSTADDSTKSQYKEVSKFLDKGGVFYAYIDFKDELRKLGGSLETGLQLFFEHNPIPIKLPLDITGALDNLGLTNFSAVGMSSRRLGDGLFHNRSILYFNEPPSGVFQWFGETSGDFLSWQYAPADADIVIEMNYRPELWRDRILDTIQSISGIMGRGLVGMQLQQNVPFLPDMTFNQLIQSLGSRIVLVIDFQEDEPLTLDNGISIPKIEFLLVFDDFADLLEKVSENFRDLPDVEWIETDYGFLLKLDNPAEEPFDYFDLEIRVNRENGLVWMGSSSQFIDRCLGGSNPLGKSEEFTHARKGLPDEGISFIYVSAPSQILFKDLLLSTIAGETEIDFLTAWINSLFPEEMHPMVSITQIRDEGIYSASNWSSSYRSKVASMTLLQPILVSAGIGAATAIPAFQKVRANSQEKTVLNNLRMVSAAGQQYILENNVESVSYRQIEGVYFSPLTPVAGEDYSELTIQVRGGTLSVELSDGRIVEYRY